MKTRLSLYRKALKESLKQIVATNVGVMAIILLVFFALLALLSPFPPMINEMYKPITGTDPQVSYSTSPSLRHLLGTDFMGRDLFSQLLEGARIAFTVGIVAAFMSVFIGTIVGLTSGYFGSLLDVLLMRIADIILTLPSLPFIIVFAAAIGKLSIWNIVLLIAIFGWPGVARVIRAQTLSLKERPYVEAAKISGANSLRIIFKHIGPNVLPFSFLYMTFGVSGAILTEAALSFIGLGDPSTVSWGMMLQWAFTTGHTFKAPYWILPPGLCISFLSLAFYLMGRALDEIINPRLRKR
ncbi:MAG: ABC transporter permease [Armatimonadetes bacterium CG07_land_8_20_14_0_80_40_9]|nr:MAG: ABC transporter permease [Armatimonadetes bacterium CG07_land_8_20_14_0_80_40_9]